METNTTQTTGYRATVPVSVILAVRNGARFLSEALESLEASTVRPKEILLIDGHSTDQTAEIAGRFRSVEVVVQDGLGIAGAYNQGIAQSSEPIVAFLSADDCWEPTKLEQQYQWLKKHPKTDAVVSRVRYFQEEGDALPPGFRPELLSQTPVAYIMETLCCRREVFARVGEFSSEFEVAEDVDWYARARDIGVCIAAIDHPLVRKRVHSSNTSYTHQSNSRFLIRAMKASLDRKRRGGP